MKIGIIGAGAAGLAALRHSLEQHHECVAFEQTDKIGGTWNYTDLIDVDQYGLPIHSSMYQGLRTNLPKEVMEYEDFPYENVDGSFIDQKEVLRYIQRFSKRYNLCPHIKFLRRILEVHPLPDRQWKLKEENVKTHEVTEHVFDAIMVCVGNYSVPKLPEIPGMELLGTKAMHSHLYRKPDGYKGKRVLVIGAGPSGVDIARIVGEVADKVYISYGNTFFTKSSNQKDYVIHKPLVERFHANKAIFEDGTEEEIDNVIYCTGYQYSYPFLTQDCGIEIENNWIKYLYKHVINVQHPTMGFIGITFKVCPFPTFGLQVRFFLEFIKNPTKLSRDEMIANIMEDVRNKGSAPQHVHKIGLPFHRSYFDDLADTVKIKKIRPVVHNLYEHLGNNRSIDQRYKILNDNEFIELN